MSKSKKLKLVTVPFAAEQTGETQAQFPFGEENSRWTWVESSVWTDCMLTALENGVKGGNAYFAELGLFSLERAHVSVSQSVQR